MIALPLVWGQALAMAQTQQFSWEWCLVAQLFGALCQVFSLYLNDYADEALDRRNDTYWLSGGSRVIPDGHLNGLQLFRAARICAVLMLVLSLLALATGRGLLPVITVLALTLGWTYSLPPLQASYRGYGELHQAISCGVILPVTGFYLQSNNLTAFPWLTLIPSGLVFFASNITTALPDLPSDQEGGKLSYAVRHGATQAEQQALLLSALACLLAVPPIWMSDRNSWLSALIPGPGLMLLGYAALTRFEPKQSVTQKNVTQKEAPRKGANRDSAALRSFMLLILGSHAWLLISWTLLLCWHGLQHPK